MAQCRGCGKFLTPSEIGLPCPNCGSMDRDITGTDQAPTMDIASAAKDLAMKHYEIEDGLTTIFRLTDGADAQVVRGTPVKLLEVNVNTPEAGVIPLGFGPAPASGIPYASIIIEVTPKEFEKIRSNELKLPEGWSIGEEFPRPSGAGGA